MENETLNFLTSALPTILTFASGVVAAYFAFRAKKVEAEPDADRALGDLQVQLSKAAENMVEPLNHRIEEQAQQLQKQHVEINELREVVRQQSNEIATLKRENEALKKEMSELQVAKIAAEKEAVRIAQRLQRIKKEIDTGPLATGKHNIPGDD